MRILLPLIAITTTPLMSFAYEQAFPKTGIDRYEIKTLPKARLVASQTNKAYFEANGDLFRPLFRYIQQNDIPMTTPVEAEMDPGVMYFYIGTDLEGATLANTENVTVHQLPERVVASLGMRGGYSEQNFHKASAKLEAWLRQNSDYEAAGPPRGIFWNGPYVPGFLKRFEVHIPVKSTED
jgi:DNA gyrase inhibitor GyrI